MGKGKRVPRKGEVRILQTSHKGVFLDRVNFKKFGELLDRDFDVYRLEYIAVNLCVCSPPHKNVTKCIMIYNTPNDLKKGNLMIVTEIKNAEITNQAMDKIVKALKKSMVKKNAKKSCEHD